jgi:hypothetical protein
MFGSFDQIMRERSKSECPEIMRPLTDDPYGMSCQSSSRSAKHSARNSSNSEYKDPIIVISSTFGNNWWYLSQHYFSSPCTSSSPSLTLFTHSLTSSFPHCYFKTSLLALPSVVTPTALPLAEDEVVGGTVSACLSLPEFYPRVYGFWMLKCW